MSGPQIRARLRLNDTWVSFRVIDTRAGTAGARSAAPRTFGLRPASRTPHAVLRGAIHPGSASGWARVERRAADGSWAHELDVRLAEGGTYRADVRRAGTYRVRVGQDAGPAVRVG